MGCGGSKEAAAQSASPAQEPRPPFAPASPTAESGALASPKGKKTFVSIASRSFSREEYEKGVKRDQDINSQRRKIVDDILGDEYDGDDCEAAAPGPSTSVPAHDLPHPMEEQRPPAEETLESSISSGDSELMSGPNSIIDAAVKGRSSLKKAFDGQSPRAKRSITFAEHH